MKTVTKIILAAAFVSSLSLSSLVRTATAQPQFRVAIMPQHHNSTQMAEAIDGDGEANDATEATENIKTSQSLAMNKNRTENQQSEASDGETNDDAEEEQQEADQLQLLAKITLQQAQQAAETAVGGRASSVELKNENGNLVYEVEIGQQEVIVDAGNGRVLYTENENQEDDKQETSRPKSSIQVPDNDGEANDYGTGQQGG